MLVIGRDNLTWPEFRDRARGRLAFGAQGCRRVPVAHDDPVRVLEHIVGAWEADLVPVPLNARWPEARIKNASRYVALGESTGRGRASEFFADRHDVVEALVIFTSGSSSEPKAAVLSFRNLNVAARGANRAIPLVPGDRWLLSLPLYHVGGIGVVMRCAQAGATIAIPGDDEALKDSILHYEPTHVSLVATQLYRLLRDESACAALAKCKAVVMGGGPTPEPLVREAVARGIPLVMSYGMTETAAMICCTRPGDPVERLLSSGRPLVDGTMSISAEGEILVCGDQLFLGYLQPDGSAHRPLTEDGWFRTGDLGHFDAAGYLHVTGRRDNMFISGGENIQPEEIEQALRAVDGVEDAIVVGVEDAEWGRRPVAFVRTADGRAPDTAALQAALRKTLPGYKVPRTIHPWPDDLVPPGLKPARRDFEARAKSLATDLTD